MLSFSPISGAPISSTEEASSPSGPQTYNLEIEDGIGFSEWIFNRTPETFEDTIEESFGVEDNLPDNFECGIEESLDFSERSNGTYPFRLIGLPNVEGNVIFRLALTSTNEKPLPSVTISWGDTEHIHKTGDYDGTVMHNYSSPGPFDIDITGDLDCITAFCTPPEDWWIDYNSLSFRLVDLSSLINLQYLILHEQPDEFGVCTNITGDLTDLIGLDNLTQLSVWKANLLTGDLSTLPDITEDGSGLNNVRFLDVTQLTGDLTVLNELGPITFYFSGCDLSYTAGLLPTWDFFASQHYSLRNAGLTATEVSNFVIDLNNSGCGGAYYLNTLDMTSNGFINESGLVARAALYARNLWVSVDGTAEAYDAGLIFSDDTIWYSGYSKTIEESLRMFDSTRFGFHLQIAESLGVAEQVKEALCILAMDFIGLNPVLYSKWKGYEQAASGISLIETSSFGKLFSDTIAEGVGLSDFSSFSFHLLILDSLICASSAQAAGLFKRQISEAMALTDSALKAWESLIEDVFSIVESASFVYGVMATVEESVSLSGNSAYLLFANEAINDSFQLQPSIALRSVLGAVVQDSLGLFGQVLIDGEVWECWVLNTNKFHPSVYSGFDFNSYAIFEGRAYGAKSDGIYELTGDTDSGSGIRSGVAFPETDFGTTAGKRFRKAFLGVAGDSTVLKVENENDYGFYSIESDKTTINRSLHGKEWKFSVLDFEKLHFIELFPVILTR